MKTAVSAKALVISLLTALTVFTFAREPQLGRGRRSSMFGRIELPAGAKLLSDVSYGSDHAQSMDVYLPAHPENAPIIFMVHGGGWAIGDKSNKQVVENKLNYFVPKGYVFISINNRLLPDANPIEQARDVARALAFAQSKAASWGADPTRIVIMGHSAGAHLVDLISSDPTIAYQLGAKPWLGTVSLDTACVDVVEKMNGRHPALYDRAFGSDHTFWESASPMHRLTKGAPPMMLVCSSLRPDRPCDQAKRYAAKVNSLGGTATVYPVALSHLGVNETLGQPSDYTDAVATFLHSLRLP